jgi:hypothetical protein
MTTTADAYQGAVHAVMDDGRRDDAVMDDGRRDDARRSTTTGAL